MPRSERYEVEAEESVRNQLGTLQKSVGALNVKVAALGPEAGDLISLRRKVLELDQRLAMIERRDLVIPYSRPFSD